MFENYQICPYTGLRSFTEEESLYFKGREDHIEQATEQLQRNKFLMLTGASGDGKSSLVYAGIVPNARAGFLKSKYTQWSVADFRPERTPFKNLCRALSKQLDIANAGIVESELQHGFSALVDLYKNSKCYIDVDSVAWQQSNDQERGALKRKASNLIIIVDQFEEFFTNPENYHHGIASRDSNLVLNVLLETARIALEEDLPIYIVFTMRSDYIGQCAAFRSLPEYIGFSQFFVPRLNRSQLQQVIEEPATLSGNKISRRLTERLIHDIAEGVDQLPILQHALNQIWHAAEQGNAEMDLIHYAMVGGMTESELPDDQVTMFREWFSKLPEKMKQFYREPNLQNVLDTHANKLYESAAESYRNKVKGSLSDESARLIIKTVFNCLTKIDQSRAVRNRMTLLEITNILGHPELTTKEVGAVLDIFREPGNTFIRPFITDEADSNHLRDDDVLDITHESLIRNWEYLEKWAKEEFDNYITSLDFEQQLNRWVESGKSGDFLLSIGPLTYFESWYNKLSPNAHWIARYLPDDIDSEAKLTNARNILDNSKEFLKKSGRKYFVTRTIMKFGPGKIAAAIALLGLLVFASFITSDYFKRQNDYVLEQIGESIGKLSGNNDALLRIRTWLISEGLKNKIVTIPEVIQSIEDPIERINVSTAIATSLVYYGRSEPANEIFESISISDSLLSLQDPKSLRGQEQSAVLKEINDLSKTLELAFYTNPSERIELLKKKHAVHSAEWVSFILKSQPQDFDDIGNLNVALEFGINQHIFSDDEIKEFIQIMSPFEKDPGAWINSRYDKDKVCEKSFFNNGFRFNGLYQELGYLYAASGDATKALQAVDSLLKYNQNYFQGDYTTAPDNASHIGATFYTYGHPAELDNFAKGYSQKKRISVPDFYSFLLARSKLYEYATTILELDPRYGFDLNLVLEYSSVNQIKFFFNKYRSSLQEVSNADDRNFRMALSYKDEAIIQMKRFEIQKRDSMTTQFKPLFDKAIELYSSVNKSYLDTRISVIDVINNDNITIARKFLFVFPDIRTPFHPNELRLYHYFYTSDCFLSYILENDLFAKLYPGAEEIQYFNRYFRDYGQVEPNPGYQVANQIKYETLVSLASNIEKSNAESAVNLNLMYLHLARESGKRKDAQKVIYYTDKLSPEKIGGLLLNSLDLNNVFRLVAESVTQLTLIHERERAHRIIKMFDNPANRSMLYAYTASASLLRGMPPNEADYLIDSARSELTRITNRDLPQNSRFLISSATTIRDPKKIDEAYAMIKNMDAKWLGVMRMCQALSYDGKLFEAVENIPDNASDPDRIAFLWFVMNGYSQRRSSEISSVWHDYDANNELFLNYYITYQDDKN